MTGLAAIALALSAWAAPVEVPVFQEGIATVPVVEATVGDDRLYFAVDVGSDSWLNVHAAARLQLQLQRAMRGAFVDLPPLLLGSQTVEGLQLEVYRDAPNVGGYELDGVLGRDVLSRWVPELDLPRNRLVLHPQGTVKRPSGAAPLTTTGVVLGRASWGDGEEAGLPIQLPSVPEARLEAVGREGGSIGAAATVGVAYDEDGVPRREHRVTLDSVRIGSREVPLAAPVRWSPRGSREHLTLLGSSVLWAEHAVTVDYQGQWIALGKRKKVRPDRIASLLRRVVEDDIERHADDIDRLGWRARVYLRLGDEAEARSILGTLLEARPDDGFARSVLARMLAADGDLAAAREMLAPLPMSELVERDALWLLVTSDLIDGRVDAAVARAEAAAELLPDAHQALAAYGEALLAAGKVEGAYVALETAARKSGNPLAHFERRARVAWMAGDLPGALAKLRSTWLRAPSTAWLFLIYADLAQEEPEALAALLAEVEAAFEPFFPTSLTQEVPVIVHRLRGETERAYALADEGIAELCDTPDKATRLNCVAWMDALARRNLPMALARVTKALKMDPGRTDFLDTLGEVNMALGDWDAARDAFVDAARRRPYDPFLLWRLQQLDRLAHTE